MTGRLRWWLAGGSLLLATAVVACAVLALRMQQRRLSLRAWIPTPAAFPGWPEALGTAAPDWQVLRPDAHTIQVECQYSGERASLYAIALRESGPQVVDLTREVFYAAQIEALDPEQRRFRRIATEPDLVMAWDEDDLVVVGHAGPALLVLNGSGLPRPDPELLGPVLDAHLARIAAGEGY